MTPPIDQRPSSSLLSFLQFVNFSKSRVDFGRALWPACASLGGIVFSFLLLAHPGRPSALTSGEEDFPPSFLIFVCIFSPQKLCFMESLREAFIVTAAAR